MDVQLYERVQSLVPASLNANPLLRRLGRVGIAVFGANLIATMFSSRTVGGILGGLIGSLIVAALFVVVAVVVVQLFIAVDETVLEVSNDPDLGCSLTELEAARQDIVRKISGRTDWMVPLGAVVGVAYWLWQQRSEHPPSSFQLLFYTFAGGAMLYTLASRALSREYRRRYKTEILPKLVSRFGHLNVRPDPKVDLTPLLQEGLLEKFDNVSIEDEIVGSYRGIDINLVPLKLTREDGEDTITVFEGLLANIRLPHSMSGTTAIVADEGTVGQLRKRLFKRGRSKVGLEHPDFERVYEVYGSDQAAARALLTPTFMERWMALAGLRGFGLPSALARGSNLTVTMPKAGAASLLEPPSYRRSALCQEALARLQTNIRSVLDLADSVIDLDHSARTSADPVPKVA